MVEYSQGKWVPLPLFPLTIQIFRKREDKYALYNNFGW